MFNFFCKILQYPKINPRSTPDYRNNRDELKVKARDKYRGISEEEKDIKREYERNRFNNMSKEDKQRPKEYEKNIVSLDKEQNYFLCTFFNI